MPFTPAHAAAALPFLRLRLVPSALIVGTMAPDFEYFLRFAPGGGFGHTVPGAFLLSLPLALAVLWVFHTLVKAPLVALFPDPIRLRIPIAPFRFGGPARFALIVISALAGIATHLLWDTFTHGDMWGGRHFPWLKQSVPVPVLGSAAHFALLQLFSSVAGLLLLCAWIARWYLKSPPQPAGTEAVLPPWRRYQVLAGIAAVALLGGMIRAAMLLQLPGPHSWVVFAGDGISTVIALAWWILVLYAVLSSRRWSRLEA